MAGNTDNVKLGICSIVYKGVDLGYTKGGVNVDVTTATHPVTVDQFGESTVNEYITKRDIKVTCPLAETTLGNLVATMPGAVLVSDGLASATLTSTVNPADAATLVVNGVTYVFKTSPTTDLHIQIGATAAATLINAAVKLSASADSLVNIATYTNTSASVLTIKYGIAGVAGNAFTLVSSSLNVVASTATLIGGAPATKARVDVSTGIGTNLLKRAGVLTLHPIANAATDLSDDLVIPLAATPGGMKFAYQYNFERIFNVDFMGYPDPVTSILYKLGDSAAV